MLFRPARAADLDEICALLATPKHRPEYYHALFAADPGFDPAQIRLAWTGGHIVACARIYPRAPRIGAVVVPSGGIGNLRTAPRYWRQGLATSLLSECVAAMYLDGKLLAPLFSSRHTLFARRGWSAISEVRLRIPARALPSAAAATAEEIHVRAFEGYDLDAVMALHEAVNAARTGSATRDRDDWLGRLSTLDLRGAVPLVAVKDGEIVGFVWARGSGKNVDILELLLAPWYEDAWLRLFQAAVDSFGGATTLCAHLPADYRRRVRETLRSGVFESTSDDLMVRIVDRSRLIQALVSHLEARLRDTNGSAAPLLVRIGPLRGGVTLCVEGAAVDVYHPRRDDDLVLPDDVFLALLLGTESARARLDAVLLPDSARETLMQLFPPQDWIFWRSDAF